MRSALGVLPAILAILSAGCGPEKLLPAPGAWPREVYGRKLYNTPRGFLYATNAANAGWMDRHLQERLPRIEEEFDVKLSKGVVIVIGPGDPPVPDVKGWPPSPGPDMMYIWLPPVSTEDFGIPESRWVCPQPTDSYYQRAVDVYHCGILANNFLNPIAIGSTLSGGWMFLGLLPRQREHYVRTHDVQRERALATAAIEFCDLSETEIEAKRRQVAEFYALQERAIRKKYAVRD